MTAFIGHMTFEEFRATLVEESAPEGLAPGLKAMWEDAKGNWSAAHSIAQEIDDEVGSWIHAYLHRKEGDLANADYWYRRARQAAANDTLREEWTRIVSRLLRAGAATLDDK